MEKTWITYWLTIVRGDVEPAIHGPYDTKELRDQHAKMHRQKDPDMYDGIYKLDIEGKIPSIESYSGGFFEADT